MVVSSPHPAARRRSTHATYRTTLEHLAEELTTWALQREKIVTLLDLRGARRARRIVEQIGALLASEFTKADALQLVASGRAIVAASTPTTAARGSASAAPLTNHRSESQPNVYDCVPPSRRPTIPVNLEDSGPINFKRLLAEEDRSERSTRDAAPTPATQPTRPARRTSNRSVALGAIRLAKRTPTAISEDREATRRATPPDR